MNVYANYRAFDHTVFIFFFHSSPRPFSVIILVFFLLQNGCDKNFPCQLPRGYYRLVGAAGSKIPKMRVPAYRCGADWSGWLDDAHTTVEDGKVKRKVCFSDRSDGYKYAIRISVKNCVSYFIYKLYPPACYSRYCGTDWMWSKKFKK